MSQDPALLQSGLFQGLSPEEIEALISCLGARTVDFPRGSVIAYAGQPQKFLGLVIEGKVSLAKENAQGQRMLLSVIRPGESFGEMNAFSGVRIWPVTVMAESSGKLMAIPLERIGIGCEKRCFGHWSLITNLLKLISEKALNLHKALDYIGIKGIRRKLAMMLIDRSEKEGHPSFKMDMNRAQMADYFYVTRPALSHELCALRDLGAIDFSANEFRIKNVQLLKQIAEIDV